jgi:hypothetical protein
MLEAAWRACNIKPLRSSNLSASHTVAYRPELEKPDSDGEEHDFQTMIL